MKTKRPTCLFSALALLLAGVPVPSAPAQEPQIPAVTALRHVGTAHGDKLISRIVRMRGKAGQPQPREWWITVYDPSAPYLVREFWVGATETNDEGPNLEYYPMQTPPGFIPAQSIKLDSVDAFDVLNLEATKAKLGFDSVNYFLRCREFSQEPIWTLQAMSPEGACVGIIDLSAQTGKVLRTVWFYVDTTGDRRGARVVDSELLGRSRLDVLESPDAGTPGLDPTAPASAPHPSDPALDPLTGRPERMIDPAQLAPGARELPLDELEIPPPSPRPRVAPRPLQQGPSNPDVDGEVPEVVPLDDDE